jgi:hypothetical protein
VIADEPGAGTALKVKVSVDLVEVKPVTVNRSRSADRLLTSTM